MGGTGEETVTRASPTRESEGTQVKASELQRGFAVRPAGSKGATKYRTVASVSPGNEPGTVYVMWRGAGGREQRFRSDAEFETQPESLPVLKSRRKTIDTYDLKGAIEVEVYSGRGEGRITVETNCIRVTCENGKNTIHVYAPGHGQSGLFWKDPTEAEHKRLADGLGVKG